MNIFEKCNTLPNFECTRILYLKKSPLVRLLLFQRLIDFYAL